ncbi:MAG TPA: hypothetical protein VEB66_07800 [Opitutaceae bacterium]|nr:hypothetical protein [Opitutaceae bacterium]
MVRPLRFCLGLLLAAAPPAGAADIAVVIDPSWSPDDPAREGAAELEILFRLARPAGRPAGFVAVGDRRGLFQDGTRRGLELAARSGVPVVRLARGPRPGLALDESWFIDGGARDPAEAAALLRRCVARHGPPPAMRSPFAPTRAEEAALRRHLALYQAEFNPAPARLAAQ